MTIEAAVNRIVDHANTHTTRAAWSTGDVLLDCLAATADEMERLRYRRRLLIAYARHLARRGPYKWSDLAPATQLSDMRVRNTYTDDDLSTVVALLYPKEPKT